MALNRSTISKLHPILVTGGGGYLGTHITEQLLKRGYKVRILDQLVFGESVVDNLKKNNNLEVVKGDASNLYDLTKAIKDTQAVVHLAGLVGDPACAIDEDFTKQMNVVATKMVKDLSKSFNLKRFIFTSSCSVYGSIDTIVTEEDKLNPVSLYSKTKIDSEKELLSEKSNTFHPVILRLATVFGHSRRPRFDLVANFFTAQGYSDGVNTVTGSTQWRPFIHASDVARATVKVLEAPLGLVDRQIFNVGDNGLNHTIGDLAQLVAKTVKKTKKGKKIKTIIKDDKSDIRNYRVSFNKIRKLLGYQAKIDLKRGIDEMYQNFQKGVYKKHYTDPMYTNIEMTKLLRIEYSNKNKMN